MATFQAEALPVSREERAYRLPHERNDMKRKDPFPADRLRDLASQHWPRVSLSRLLHSAVRQESDRVKAAHRLHLASIAAHDRCFSVYEREPGRTVEEVLRLIDAARELCGFNLSAISDSVYLHGRTPNTNDRELRLYRKRTETIFLGATH